MNDIPLNTVLEHNNLGIHLHHKLCNVPIQECDSIKYLGVTIDSRPRLSWSEHVDVIFHKAIYT